ncbi:MAG: YqcC family protein, partial [Aeromonas sp.]
MNQYLLVAGLLGELTAELQRLERWQADHPGDEALA